MNGRSPTEDDAGPPEGPDDVVPAGPSPVPIAFFHFDLRRRDGLTVVPNEERVPWPFPLEYSHEGFAAILHPDDRVTFLGQFGAGGSLEPNVLIRSGARLRTPDGGYRKVRFVQLATFEEGEDLPSGLVGACFLVEDPRDEAWLDRVLISATDVRTSRTFANDGYRRLCRVPDDAEPREFRRYIRHSLVPRDLAKIDVLMVQLPLTGIRVLSIPLQLREEFGGNRVSVHFLRFWSSPSNLHLVSVGFEDSPAFGAERRVEDLERCLQLSLEAHTRFIDATTSLGDAIAVFDGTRLIHANEALLSLLGYESIHEFDGGDWSALFDADEAARVNTKVVPAFEREGHWRGDLRVRGHDGRPLDLECTINRMRSGMVCGTARDVSERKSAESALRLSEERVTLAVEGADLIVWAWDGEGGVTIVGDRFAEKFGRSVDDIRSMIGVWARLLDAPHGVDVVAALARGDGWSEPLSGVPALTEEEAEAVGFIHHADVPALVAAIADHVDGRTGNLTAEYRLRTREGGWIWVLLDGRIMVREPDGHPLRVAGIGLEITGRKEAELAARLQNRVARLFAANDDPRLAATRVVEAVARDLEFDVALLWRSTDPSKGFLLTASWSRDEARYPELFEESLSCADPADGCLASRVLRGGEPLWVDPAEFAEEFACCRAARDCGLHTLVGFPLEAGDHLSGVLILYSRASRPREAATVELLRAVGSQAGQFIQRSVSEYELRRRSIELARANEELAESVKSRDDFLATLSHELRTPLTAILGTAESLRRGFYGELAEEHRRRVEGIETTGWHLSKMINEIFDMLKFKFTDVPLHETEFSLLELCREALDMAGAAAEEAGIRIGLSAESCDLVLRADRRRVLQALSNLVSNAVKFTPSGRAIGLTFVLGAGEEPDVEVSVWDEGPGIDLLIAERLFDPYVQSERGIAREGSGLGLGLPLARAIARRHGGDVRAGVRPQGGAEFTIVLPPSRIVRLVREEAVQPNDLPGVAVPAGGPLPGGFVADGQRILVVDDSPVNRDLMVTILQFVGYEVETATGALEGIAAARARRPDAILMDVMMPGVDGLTAMRELRAGADTADIPILAVTAANVPGDRERCIEAGADAYLAKPFSTAHLERLVAGLVVLGRSERRG